MSSSISGSEDASAWGGCLAACLGTLALCAALIFAVMIAVDPYDSGRFGLLGIKGVSDANPRIANASRARDLQFDAAVIGDSTAILLSPAQLSQKAGMRFVKLTAYGFDPREQLAAGFLHPAAFPHRRAGRRHQYALGSVENQDSPRGLGVIHSF
jgi:hypothetical protein